MMKQQWSIICKLIELTYWRVMKSTRLIFQWSCRVVPSPGFHWSAPWVITTSHTWKVLLQLSTAYDSYRLLRKRYRRKVGEEGIELECILIESSSVEVNHGVAMNSSGNVCLQVSLSLSLCCISLSWAAFSSLLSIPGLHSGCHVFRYSLREETYCLVAHAHPTMSLVVRSWEDLQQATLVCLTTHPLDVFV